MAGTFLLLSATWPIVARAALLPPDFINSVVALGTMQSLTDVGQPPRFEWQTAGTGFFYGRTVQDDPDPLKRQYEIYLVTAKHVVQDFLSANNDLSVRVNPKGSASQGREFAITSRSQPGFGTWFCHPDQTIDVAAVQVSFPFLKAQGIEPSFFAVDQHVANRELLRKLEVEAGDGIFVLGFPMGLSGAQRNYVIVRQGAIARIGHMLGRVLPTFMIDAFVFPGNSGGPVVLRPETASIAGTKGQSSAYLIGFVTAYRPYVDTAVSQQTGHSRITFEENSGLADVLPTDVIDEAIQAWQDRRGSVGGPACS
jgi:S1-C subfamily serine protease